MRPIVKRSLKLAGLIVISSGILFLGALIHEYPLWFFGIRNINTPRYFPDPVFRQGVERFMGVRPGEPFSEYQASIQNERFYMDNFTLPPNTIVKSLKGIEYLQSLEDFRLSNYTVDEIDLRQNENLVELSLQNLSVQKILFPKNSKLESISISESRLEKLNLLDLPHLQRLSYTNCGMTSLDLSLSPNLVVLSCSSNQLTALDLSRNPKLQRLDCDGNLLASLNLAPLSDLRSLNCNNNRISFLDVSQNLHLVNLNCNNNQIKQINFGNSNELTSLNCSNNQIEDIKNIAAFPWLYLFWIENNRLDQDDRADLMTIKKRMDRLGSENITIFPYLSYSPQPGIDPYILPATP